jgi:excisionase family DNA binding protein
MRALPTLADLAAYLDQFDARRMADLPREAIPEILGALARVEALLRLRLTDAIAGTPSVAPEDRWLTPGEVAHRAGFKTPYVLELCRRGALPSVRQGKYVRIPESGFRAWQAARTTPLDRTGSVTLPSHHDAGRGTARAQGPRAVAVEIRRAPRRAPGDGQEMGNGGSGLTRHQRAADPVARGPADGPA